MNDFQKYKSAKQNILDYINDRDKFNRVYYLISENIEILDSIVNKTYKNFDYVDKALVQTFVQHLKGVMETAETPDENSETN
jgi:hypothetical protein